MDSEYQKTVPLEQEATKEETGHETLKYQLLGPSLTKAGQDSVDQQKVLWLDFAASLFTAAANIYLQVSEIIYNASKGSKYFINEETRDKNLSQKIERILAKKKQLDQIDLSHSLRKADELIASLELTRDLSQTVVHIDCDAFYAAVEELDRPELRNVPMAVGKGVLTTCNYHARKFGCRSGMAGFIAMKLCPQLVCLELNFEKYNAKAQDIREILADYDARFESASIDEAYLNITAYCKHHELEPEAAVTKLRAEIREKTMITVSAGIAPNTTLAKIASNKNKPDGQFKVANDRSSVMDFMRDLPVRKVNGVGRVFERELAAIGIKTCGDVYELRAYLSTLFGEKAFHFLIRSCYLGIGRTIIQPAAEYERKSVGTESTFREMGDKTQLREKLRWTTQELEKDMARAQVKGRTLVLKVKLNTYEVFTRQVILPKSVHLSDDLFKFSLPVLFKLEQEIPNMKLRLMGLRCTNLVHLKKENRDFFGRTLLKATEQGLKRKATVLEQDGSEWEVWLEEEFEEAERIERQEEMEEMISLSQELEFNYRRHGKEILPNPKPSSAAEILFEKPGESDQHWVCPICSQAQRADDTEFNAHIDLCLSRKTIKEVARETAPLNKSRPRSHEKSWPLARQPQSSRTNSN
ncbi:MAG: hypothetical protein M1829_001239 [Trizodia sp. TS-e1964]|nr:MAG: hypothetical protein M1829_001239 [Trizodia sp. TS-e1964]